MASRFDKERRSPEVSVQIVGQSKPKNRESEVVMLLYIVTPVLCGHVTSVYGHFRQSGGVRVCLTKLRSFPKVLRHCD